MDVLVSKCNLFNNKQNDPLKINSNLQWANSPKLWKLLQYIYYPSVNTHNQILLYTKNKIMNHFRNGEKKTWSMILDCELVENTFQHRN